MLLSSLQSQSQSSVSTNILTNTNQSSRQASLMLLLASKERSMWSTITQWNTKSLTVTKSNVTTKFSRRLKQRQSKQVSGTANLSTNFVGHLYIVTTIQNTTVSGR